jgi:hypothetical protein
MKINSLEPLTDDEIDWIKKAYKKSHPSKESKNNIIARLIISSGATILPLLLVAIFFNSQVLMDTIDLPTFGLSVVVIYCIFFCVSFMGEVQANFIKLQNIKKLNK